MTRVVSLAFLLVLISCATTELIESPKTAFVPETAELKEPSVIWTSRTMTRHFDYLGVVKVRSWTYEGALQRLIEGGKTLRADAITDVHYRQVGFFSTFQAFAIKFK